MDSLGFVLVIDGYFPREFLRIVGSLGNTDASQYGYYATVTIGGKQVVITLSYYKGGVSIVYGLPD